MRTKKRTTYFFINSKAQLKQFVHFYQFNMNKKYFSGKKDVYVEEVQHFSSTVFDTKHKTHITDSLDRKSLFFKFDH